MATNSYSSTPAPGEFLGDAHRHLTAQQSNHAHQPKLNEPVIICTDDPSAWPQVKTLAMPHCFPAFGLHPWQISSANFSHLQKSISSLPQYWPLLTSQNLPCILGEIGLDNSRRYQTTFNLQQIILQDLLDIPFPEGRILNLHVVHAWEQILSAPLREKIFQIPHQKVIFHSFNASPEILRQIQKYPQVYFSFSMAHLNHQTTKLISQLDPSRILIESDCDQPTDEANMLRLLRQTKNYIAQLGYYDLQEFDQRLKCNWQNLMQKIC